MAFLVRAFAQKLRDSQKKVNVSLHTIFCFLLTCHSACEVPSAPNGQFQTQGINEAQAGMRPDEIAGDIPNMSRYQESLDGYWLHYSQVSTCVDIGSSLEQINRSLYLVKVKQSDHGGLEETWEACQIDLTPVISVQARVPDALRQSVYPLTTEQGLLVGNPPQQRYNSGPMAEIWGIRFEQSLLDTMPTQPDDERIYDMDDDGEVGVTLYIGDTCLAYMTQRRVTHYQGELVAPDEIQGQALSVTEQYIIDASAPICKTAYQTRSNPQRSHFNRIRVDGLGGALDFDQNEDGSIDCEEVLSQRQRLFPSRLQVMEVDHEGCSL